MGNILAIISLDGSHDEFVEHVVINALVIGAISSTKDGVGDFAASFVNNDGCDTFFCANDSLVGLVDAVHLILGNSICGNGWGNDGGGCAGGGSGGLGRERVLGGVEALLRSSFSMPLPGLLGLYVLLRVHLIPEIKVVISSWLYCQFEVLVRGNLLTLSHHAQQWWSMQ